MLYHTEDFSTLGMTSWGMVWFVLKASGRSPAEGVGTLGARVTGAGN